MPTTKGRNIAYKLFLPIMAPSPRGQMTHTVTGQPLTDIRAYETLLCRHHVLGSCLYLSSGTQYCRIDTSIGMPRHIAEKDTMYRVASITKTATALVTLLLIQEGALTLDTPVAALLPDGDKEPALRGITVRQLLSHTSSLRDIPACDRALAAGDTWHDVLREPGIRSGEPGGSFSYCNFGFGLLGCALEQVTGMDVDALYDRLLFTPLDMRATLNGGRLDERKIMPISRVLRYRRGADITVTPLGRRPITGPDPERHFGYTAGAMYTDAPSLSRMLTLIARDGAMDNRQLLKPVLIREMKRTHATYGKLSIDMDYGLGLLLLRNKNVSGGCVMGHQGFAYGCVDGAFLEEGSGRQLVFLNGGCSEARDGRLSVCNRDLLRWALQKEIGKWPGSVR